MAESLNPTLISRARTALHPDWTRTAGARRTAAGLLVVLAAVAAFRPDPGARQAAVVVTTRDVGPGTVLTSADVALAHRSATTVPDGAAGDPAEVLGATLAGPARRGEVLTDLRLLGTRLTESAGGPDARLVPVHPADAALVDLLRPGDVVDVVTTAPADSAVDAPTGPRLVAAGGVVVLVSAPQRASTEDRVVLVALPAGAAHAVAAAALVQPVTFTLH